jgi:hypothetical protein
MWPDPSNLAKQFHISSTGSILAGYDEIEGPSFDQIQRAEIASSAFYVPAWQSVRYLGRQFIVRTHYQQSFWRIQLWAGIRDRVHISSIEHGEPNAA